MFSRLRGFFQRHPVLREVLFWAAPALVLGAALRCLLLNYHPYAYWGSDSKSYYSFAHQLLSTGDVSLDEKRRYLYPILMLPVSLLPGAPLKWVAWLQHLLGLSAVLPLAYVVRKTFRFWRWWIVPVTVAYVGLPLFLWYEHELLGESLFFIALAWTFGGWVAWVSQSNVDRARRHFWWFFIPLAIFLLTKPSGRFFLPGLALGLLAIRAWRVLDWRRWTALGLLCAATLTVGSKKQAAWLLYVAVFPLTQLDSPLYAEYKAQLRPYAQPFIDQIGIYHYTDKRGMDGLVAPFHFLETPSEENAPPLWAALDKDSEKKRKLYMALALEGIKARPDLFLYLGAQRLIGSVNLSGFEENRFNAEYYARKVEGLYESAQKLQVAGKGTSLPMAFGFTKGERLPAFESFAPRLAPKPEHWSERALLNWARGYHAVSDVVKLPARGDGQIGDPVKDARLTPLGWWMVAALCVSIAFWRTLGIWLLAALGYLVLMFLVSHTHTRYFAPAWIVFLPMLVAPLDLALRVFRRREV